MTHGDETLTQWHARMSSATPELEQLHRLLAAVEHYERVGWLSLPEHEQWKLDELKAAASALVGRWR